MKTLNKLGLLGVFATTCALPIGAKALTTSLPAADENGVVTLTEDVNLAATLVLKADSNIKTIDLNGHTLSRGVKYGYLINSSTDLTIKNGNIVCAKEQDVIDGKVKETSSSSCVRNNKSLVVEDVKLDAYWTALKAEEGTKMSVKNSTVTSESGTAGTILNYGDTAISGSSIKGASVKNGTAIFTMSIFYGGKSYDANVSVNDSTLQAYWPIFHGKYDEASENALEPRRSTVTLEGNNTIISDYGFIRKDTKRDGVTSEINGDITAPIDALDYMKTGTTLTLNKDVTEETVVKEGYTVVVPNGVNVENGMLKLEAGAKLENKSGNDITFIFIADEEKEITLKNNGIFEGKEIEEPTDPVDPEDPKDPEEPKDPENPEDPEEPRDPETPGEKEPNKNPQTFDGVAVYASLLAISAGGVGLVLKKHLN